jgi:tetratricopeptide (TPR) repeat protein
MLFILTATLHNVKASGEVIPIAAHSGLTLALGNGPDARGGYTYLPGISERRSTQHESARRSYQASTGREGTWKEVDRHYRAVAVTWWREHPGAAAALFARKAYYFVSGVHYDDMMPVTLEREYGIARRSWLAPLPTPWLLGAALAALLATGLQVRRFMPELILLALPLVVVVLFLYSPRYRLPALPIVCGLAAMTLIHWRRLRIPKALVALLCLLPIAATLLNPVIGFDRPDDLRAPYARQLSGALMRQGHRELVSANLEEGESRLRAALEVEPANRIARRLLGEILLERGKPEEAVAMLRRAAEDYRRGPPDPRALAMTYRLMGNGLAGMGRLAAAAESWTEALKLEPNHTATRIALAWLLATAEDESVRNGRAAAAHAEAARRLTHPVDARTLDLLAAAAAEAGRFEEATVLARRALEILDPDADTGLAGAIARRLALYERRTAAREAPRMVPVRE